MSLKLTVFVLTSVLSLQVWGLEKITLKKIWQIPTGTKLGNYEIGGLSGCSKSENEIYFVSDDRGKSGDPRILIMKYDSEKASLNLAERRWLPLAKSKTPGKIYDMEGIAHASKDRILISSEGDLGQKPRQSPELFWINAQGQRVGQIQLPDKFLPNSTGKQVKGIQGNKGFEGLNIDLHQQTWGALLEDHLVQDKHKLLLLEGSVSGAATMREWMYPLPHYDSQGLSTGVGVTDFVYKGLNKLIVIERGVHISFLGLKYDAQICIAEKISSTQSLYKSCFYDFSTDKALTSKVKKVENYEGICWLNDQKTQFLVINDNNFSKSENNLFLLYQID